MDEEWIGFVTRISHRNVGLLSSISVIAEICFFLLDSHDGQEALAAAVRKDGWNMAMDLRRFYGSWGWS